MSPFLLLAALVPAAFLMVQVYRLDRIEKEPAGLLLKLVLFGALSGLAAGAIEGALTRLLDVTLGGSMLRLMLENFLAVALVEEACKRWVVLKFAWRHPAFDYRFDAVVYSVSSALGFAAVENILYVVQSDLRTAVWRIFSTSRNTALPSRYRERCCLCRGTAFLPCTWAFTSGRRRWPSGRCSGIISSSPMNRPGSICARACWFQRFFTASGISASAWAAGS